MSIDTKGTRRAHLADAGTALREAVDRMNDDARRDFLQDLMEALVEHDAGREEPLALVFKRLQISMQLHSQADFTEAVKRSDGYDWEPVTDISAYLSDLHDRGPRT